MDCGYFCLPIVSLNDVFWILYLYLQFLSCFVLFYTFPQKLTIVYVQVTLLNISVSMSTTAPVLSSVLLFIHSADLKQRVYVCASWKSIVTFGFKKSEFENRSFQKSEFENGSFQKREFEIRSFQKSESIFKRANCC